MNDSDQDFVDLSSKLLKRSRKKGVEPKRRRADQQASCQTSDGDQRENKDSSGSQRAGAESQFARSETQQVMGNTENVMNDLRDAVLASAPTAQPGLGAKDKLLSRMQQFKRVNLPKMVQHVPLQSEILQSSTSERHLRPQDSDEVLAMRLQQRLDHEAAEAHTLDLAAEGLFFCHICHRSLSHMTPEGRTQHINRCLDKSEHQMAAVPPPPGVPDCPICGKKFKSHKSHATHLKRCSADMGVSPADLLQALQRQAEETQRTTTEAITQTGGAKRKGASKAGPAARKKPRKKAELLDEDTMVALALSSSLLEQERKQLSAERETITPDFSMAPVLKWRADAGKGHGKRKKGTVPRPPPILLIQDADAALTRLQERVSALLLRSRAPSPPTPTRCPSTLSALSDTAPLWEKSALLNGSATRVLDFFVPELKDFITPWESAQTLCASSQTNDKASILSSSQTAACSSAPSTPTSGHLPANSQALQDLVELSVDEFAHGDHTALGPVKDKNTSLPTDLRLSGFFIEETADLCVSDAPPAMTHTDAVELHSQAGSSYCQPGATEERRSHLSVALSTLASNLSSMVNNPHLSDWQLQVDSGQVFFAHSFMIYARCPLLAEMVHESGFGVHEEGMPAAQRVLISDVPGQAVLALLHFLYTAHFSLPASFHPHVLELASRFDLQELQQLCELHTEEASAQNDDEAATSHAEGLSHGTDKDLTALFISMWSHEDDRERDDEGGLEKAADVTSGDRELHEEQVNEEELDEIYEFAATQRKRDEEEVSVGGSEGTDGEMSTEPRETPGRSSDKSPQPESDPQPDHSLDSSYDRLFLDFGGVYKEDDQPSFSPPSSTPPRETELSGRAPNQDGNFSTVAVKEEIALVGQELPKQDLRPLKPQSQVTDSLHVPLLSNSPQKKDPEVIVLSDSSEDMDVSVPQSPVLSQSHTKQNFTYLKPREPSVEREPSRNLECSLVDRSPSPNRLDRVDCSPELSWLIPSTPVNTSPRRSSSESCAQLMRRAELFPKKTSSSPFSNASKTSSSPTCISPRVGSVEGTGSRLNLERAEVDSPVSFLSGVSNHLHDSSKQEPNSSTPLHLDVRQHHIRADTSPGRQKSFSHEHEESFHLSPFSDPSEPHSSTAHRSVESSERPRKCSSSHNSTGFKPTRTGTTDEDGKILPVDDDGIEEEAKSPNASFEHSLLIMDEPPIAFNDSWGLNACDDVTGNPGCFSLRLEDSGGCSRAVSSATSPSPPSCQDGASRFREPKNLTSRPSTSKEGHAFMPSTTDHVADIPPEISDSLLVAHAWESSEEEEEMLPLSQRLKASARLKTPSPPRKKKHHTLVPITPLPHYSDMDTPELKNKLNSEKQSWLVTNG
ncbi:uncharacterized protein slx4 isoform X2 [Vanacampus margaritifer]